MPKSMYCAVVFVCWGGWGCVGVCVCVCECVFVSLLRLVRVDTCCTPKTPPCQKILRAKNPGSRCQNYIFLEDISAEQSLAEKEPAS